MTNKSTTVSANINEVESGLIKVDVNIQNAPHDLFGAAFHLKIKGSDWNLLEHELGPVFKDEGFEPLVLVSNKTTPIPEIIFGVSLKRGSSLIIKDGTIVSFYLETNENPDLTLEFTNQLLTTLQENRQDIENAIWENPKIEQNQLANNPESIIKSKSLNLEEPSDLQTNILINEENPLPKTILIDVYTLLAIVFSLIFFSLIAYFLHIKRRLNRK